MRSLYYAYRHKESGHVFTKGSRPYLTKGAAAGAVTPKYVKRDPDEAERFLQLYGYRSETRRTTPTERRAHLSEHYELVTYELREVQ